MADSVDNVVENYETKSKMARIVGAVVKAKASRERKYFSSFIRNASKGEKMSQISIHKLGPKIEMSQQIALLRDFQDFGYNFVITNCLPNEIKFVQNLEKLSLQDSNDEIKKLQELVCL